MNSDYLSTRRSALVALGLSTQALTTSSSKPPLISNKVNETPGVVDLLDVLPLEVRKSTASEGSLPDISKYMQSALASFSEHGGLLRVPAGIFKLGSTIIIPPRVRIVGIGRATSIFQIAHDGDGFLTEAPINSFTPVNIGIAHLAIVCLDNRASKGAGYHDRGGTYVDLHDVRISGFKYGCLLDQSELANIDLCQLEYSHDAAIWLVNGPDQNPRAQTTFTNRICVSRCQINQADGFGVIDDGGRAHSFRDNNFNGCRLGHIRLAGYGEYVLDGNYFEESAGVPILISNQTVRGRNVQRPNSVVITGNLVITKSGQPAINFEGATAATITGNTFVGERTPSIQGLNTVETLVSDGNAIQNLAGPFENTRALRRQRSGELTIDHLERLRLASIPAGSTKALRIRVANAQPGDMAMVSFEPTLMLRVFMPVVQADHVVVELENAGTAPTMPVDVTARIRLLKA